MIVRHAQCLLVVLAFLIWLPLLGATGRDDSHITYWQSYALTQHGGFVNIAGDNLEQSSSFVHTVLLALLYALSGMSIPLLGYIVGALAAVASIVATFYLAERYRPGAGLIAASILATTSAFVYWSFGGLESTVSALLFVLWAGCIGLAADSEPGRKGALAVSCIACALLPATRPEFIFAIAAVLAFLVVWYVISAVLGRRQGQALSRRPFNVFAINGAVAALSMGILALWRFFTFDGKLFPAPVYAKTGKSRGEAVRAGLEYYGFDNEWVFFFGLFFVVVLLQMLRFTEPPSPARGLRNAITGAALAYLAFIVAVGGDWMELGRFFSHIAPLLALVAAMAFVAIEPPQVRYAAAVGFVASNLILSLLTFRYESTGTPYFSPDYTVPMADATEYDWVERSNRIHRREIPTIEVLNEIVGTVHDAHPERPVSIMSGQAGMVCYYIGQKFYGNLVWYDRCMLSSTALYGWAEPEDFIERHSHAVPKIMWEDFFAMLADPKEGAPRPPDIIFDIDLPDASELEENGYTLVYDQGGFIYSGASLIRGNPVDARQSIGVRSDLAGALGMQYREFRF